VLSVLPSPFGLAVAALGCATRDALARARPGVDRNMGRGAEVHSPTGRGSAKLDGVVAALDLAAHAAMKARLAGIGPRL